MRIRQIGYKLVIDKFPIEQILKFIISLKENDSRKNTNNPKKSI